MSLLLTVITVALAFTLGRSMLIFGFLSYAIGWPALAVLILVGAKAKTWENRLAWIEKVNQKIEQNNKPEGYKDFETVDDLMKQLETK